MALTKCPECGRENVSDKAEFCPACGYGIKAHYARIEEEERQEQIKRKQEELERKYEEIRLSNIKRPEKPKAFNVLMFFGVLGLVVGVLGIIIPEMAVFPLLEFGAGAWLCYEASKQYEKEKKEYELSLTDFEEYQKQQLQKEDERRRREKIKENNAIKCPVCGSANTERITSVDRAVSVGLVGLASGKIGKQYKCKNCKHMW